MLVLSRKVGQRILIGEDVSITIVRIGQGGVRVGISAPKEMAVVREELAQQQAVSADARASEDALAVEASTESRATKPANADACETGGSTTETDTARSRRVLPR